jgi:hypothetical protein
VQDSVVRELRAVQRYKVNLPVCLTRRAPGASRPPLNALTRDISTRGMFVVAETELAEGELLEFEIDMALDEATPLMVVQGEGRVVRTERNSQRATGFAVHNVWFRLREPEQGQALPLDWPAAAGASALFPPRALDAYAARHRGLSIVPRPARTDSDQGGTK